MNNNYDGTVIIGTKIDTSGIDRGAKEIENKSENISKKSMVDIKYNPKDLAELDKYIEDISRKIDKLEEKARKPFEIDGAMVTGSWNLSAQEQKYYDRLLETYNSLTQKKRNLLDAERQITQNIQEQTIMQDSNAQNTYKLVNGVMYLADGTRVVSKEMSDVGTNIEEIKRRLNDTGKGIMGVIKKTGRWALAIFGIKSTYMAIRQAINSLMEYDEELKVQIEYIKFVFAKLIEPIIRKIVDIAIKILGVIGSITKKLFNYDIFSKDIANSFKSTLNSAKGIKKELAGFDEMNILGGNISDLLSAFGAVDKINNALNNFDWKKFWLGDYDSFDELLDDFFPTLKKKMRPITDWIERNIIAPLRKYVADTIEGLKPVWKPVFDSLVPFFQTVINKMKPIWDEFVGYITPNVIEPTEKAFKIMGDNLLKIFGPTLNTIIDMINTTFGIFGVHLDHIKIESGEAANEIKKDFKEAGKTIDNNVNNSLSQTNTKLNEIDGKKVGISVEFKKAKSSLEGLWELLKQMFLGPWNLNVQVSAGGSGSGRGFAKGGIVYSGLPRLASGAIANHPGRGIPTFDGGAKWAEAGAEAYLPLTDEQIMSTLGQSIGKHVTINATIPVYAYNRQVDRQMRRIQAEDAFASNE